MTDRLLTPQEIAEYLGVKPSTIYQWTHQGYIPYVKLGKFIRFKKFIIDRWIEKRSEGGRKGKVGRLNGHGRRLRSMPE